MKPTIGRIVWYRSRTGFYTVPAMIVATQDTLAPEGVERFEESGGMYGVPPLSSPLHLHLVVFTPGIPRIGVNLPQHGHEVRLDERMPSENLAGTYQEWNVPRHDPAVDDLSMKPGTWTWPIIVNPSEVVG